MNNSLQMEHLKTMVRAETREQGVEDKQGKPVYNTEGKGRQSDPYVTPTFTVSSRRIKDLSMKGKNTFNERT